MSTTPTPVKVRSLGGGGLYEIVGTDYLIERCSWENASTTGINSVRPLWVITQRVAGEQFPVQVPGEYTTLRDAKIAAAALIAG